MDGTLGAPKDSLQNKECWEETIRTSMPIAPVKNMVRRLNRGEMSAIVVPLMKLHPVFPRLIIDFVYVLVIPTIVKILLR
jgi:hypothetical protein